MTTFRVRKPQQYVNICQQTADDLSISLEAKGLLLYLLGRPDNWRICINHLRSVTGCGRDRIYRIMRELARAGYVVKQAMRDAAGRIKSYCYDIHESPDLRRSCPLPEKPEAGHPLPEKPFTEKPETDIRTLTNTEVITNTDREREKAKTAADAASPSGVVSSSSEKPRSKPKAKTPETIDPMTMPIPMTVSLDAWADWVEYKDESGKPLRLRSAAKAALRILSQFTEAEQQKMVDYSVAGGYPALYANRAKDESNEQTEYRGSLRETYDIAMSL